MLSQYLRLTVCTTLVLGLCLPALGQIGPDPHSSVPIRSLYAHLNQNAIRARSGDLAAIRELADQMFTNAGVPSAVPDAFGLTKAIVTSEAAYRSGGQPPLHEQNVVNAVNAFAAAISAPAWTHTSQIEVRAFRMHLMVELPQLFVNRTRSANGQYSPASADMSPLEASWIAIGLLRQKVFNSNYQFTDAERASQLFLDPPRRYAAHLERSQQLLDLINGRTSEVSIRDLLSASSYFFGDLGITPGSGLDVEKVLMLVSTPPSLKGARQ